MDRFRFLRLPPVDPPAVFAEALAIQRAKLKDSSLTPSARVLAAIAEQGDSFFRFALAQSQEHDAYAEIDRSKL